MRNGEIGWIVGKTSKLLLDKVEEDSLGEEDIDLAFEIFAEPRLRKLSESFSNEEEYRKAEKRIKCKLREIAEKLNEEKWSKKGF